MESDKSVVELFMDSGDEESEKCIEEQNEFERIHDDDDGEWLNLENEDAFPHNSSARRSFQSTEWPQSYRSDIYIYIYILTMHAPSSSNH